MESACATQAFELSLRLHGLHAYVPRFQQAALPHSMLHTLTNAQLREELCIPSLAHRRRLLQLLRDARAHQPHSMLPAFGEVLVLLSSERTLHSWLRSALQLGAFALALARLREPPLAHAFAIAIAIAAGAVLHVLLGALAHAALLRSVQRGARFAPARVGAELAALLALTTAALVVAAIVTH